MSKSLPYLKDTRAAKLARIVKDGAIFLRPEGSTPPTGLDWAPGKDDASVGYYSEEGFELAAEAGDATDQLGHNGDILISDQLPGWWTVGFSGLEGRNAITAAYFDVAESDIGADGSVAVESAANSTRYDMITVGLDQKDRPVLIHYPSVQISEKEPMVFNRETMVTLGVHFRTFKGGADAPYHLKAWGLIIDEEETKPETKSGSTTTTTTTPKG